jgi:hypothetical protein
VKSGEDAMANDYPVKRELEDFEKAINEADVFLRAIALVAKGEEPEGLRAEINNAMPEIESEGLTLAPAVERIWAGERDEAVLIDGVNQESAVVIRRILELIRMPSLNEIVETLPPSLQQAMMNDDQEAFMAAINELSDEEQMAVTESLAEAGFFGHVGDGVDMNEVMTAFEPVLIAISEVAKGGVADGVRAEVEQELAYMEENDVHIREAVHRIWAGERDAEKLISELDSIDAQLVERILYLIGD